MNHEPPTSDAGPRPDVEQVRWRSDRPYDELVAACDARLPTPDLDDLGSALWWGNVARAVRRPDLLALALDGMRRHRANEWARASLAAVELLLGDTGGAESAVREELARLPGLPAPLAVSWLQLAAQLGPDLLGETLLAAGPDSDLDRWPTELDLAGSMSSERRATFRHRLCSEAAAGPPATPESADAFLRALCAAAPDGRLIRPQSLPWTAVDRWRESTVAWVVREALLARDEGRGWSLVRLGDGEGGFLAGTWPGAGGVAGLTPDGGTIALSPEDLERASGLIRSSVADADVVGLPDLTAALEIPFGYTEVVMECLRLGVPAERLLFGGSGLHWALEASGLVGPLLAAATGVIGPIDPRRMRLPLPPDVSWLPIPGERVYHDVPADRPHWGEVFERTLAHPFRPGEVWLVGAGIVGKAYLGAIRAAGAVAVDVGALMDLWAGMQGTRGIVRNNPWLCAPYSALNPA